MVSQVGMQERHHEGVAVEMGTAGCAVCPLGQIWGGGAEKTFRHRASRMQGHKQGAWPVCHRGGVLFG